MQMSPSDEQISRYRDEVARRWREANRLSIELYLRAQEGTDTGLMAQIMTEFDSVIAGLRKSRSQVAA